MIELSNLAIHPERLVPIRARLARELFTAVMDDSVASKADPIELFHKVQHTERKSRETLERLAIKVVSEYLAVGSHVWFEAELVDKPIMPRLGLSMSKHQERDLTEALKQQSPTVILEANKRYLLNALADGGAHAIQNLFHLVAEELNVIDPNLLTLYKALMKVGDANFLTMSREMLQCSGESGLLGVSHYQWTGDGLRVVAKAGAFPILVHELAKGALRGLAHLGLPEDPQTQVTVLDLVEQPCLEPENIMLGSVIWPKVWKALKGTQVVDKVQALRDLIQLPASKSGASPFTDSLQKMLT